MCDGASRHQPKAGSQEALQKGSCAKETREWTWTNAGESLLLLARCAGGLGRSFRCAFESPMKNRN